VVFITETDCVYCTLQTVLLNTVYVNLGIKRVNFMPLIWMLSVRHVPVNISAMMRTNGCVLRNGVDPSLYVKYGEFLARLRNCSALSRLFDVPFLPIRCFAVGVVCKTISELSRTAGLCVHTCVSDMIVLSFNRLF